VGASVKPETTYSPDNPFAPKGGSPPQGYSPDNPFASPALTMPPVVVQPLMHEPVVVTPQPVRLPAVTVTAPRTIARGQPAPSARVAPPLPPPNEQERADFPTRVTEAIANPVLHPIETAKGMARSVVTANRAAAENEAAANVGAAGGNPDVVQRTVSPIEARNAAIQTAAILALPVAPELERVVGGAMAPAIGSRAAGALARTATSAGYGAALNPEDPALGAVAGGVAGVASDVVSPARAKVRRVVTNEPSRMLPDEATPRTPTGAARVTEVPPVPEGPGLYRRGQRAAA
jgi:hypothetical protein